MPGQNPILTYVIEILEVTEFTTEFLLRESGGPPVLSAACAHWEGKVYRLEPGTYSLSFELQLPYLASGKYSIDIGLSQPGISFYDHITEALSMNILPVNMPGSGYPFALSNGSGYSIIKMNALFDEESVLV
jgi:hypothetical protein